MLWVKFAKWFKILRWGLIVAYIYYILTKTIIGRPVQPEPVFKPLFWEIQSGYWQDIALNILLFVPFGLLVGGWKGLILGVCLSLGIEEVQYVFRIGVCELDDVINNSLGTGIGVLLNRTMRVIVTKHMEKHNVHIMC